ncbi:hypothetical protein SLEP1_g38490 [Rubroshorea leprosula]|nr:hypothetical protein SLEP1_g38490 [Rubroshorea leprosula]
MLFDGCFVVELIRKIDAKELTQDNGHLLTHFILRTVMRDMLLIENQLPFFILMVLFDLSKMPNEADQNFMHMAINCFSIMMPGPCNKKIKNHPGIKHLLGLLHDSCISPDYGGSSEEDKGSSEEARCSPCESLDEKVNPLSFSSKVSPPESPEGVRLRSPEAMAIACSAKSVSSSTTKPSEIVRSLSSDALLMNRNLSGLESARSAKSKSRLLSLKNHYLQKCSASFARFSPTKTSEEEKSLLSNTVLMTPQLSEIEAGSVSFEVSQTSGGVNPRPSDTILTNIHHSGMGAESESFVVCVSSVGAIEDLRTAKSEGHEEEKRNWQTIGSASELHGAGIKFENKIEGRLFDINFEKGVMSIPTLKIVDDTESILRNLVAYEQCYKDISSRHFIDYIRFMDCLINTGKDVELLRRHEIIENRLGDNEVIADIFNRICDSVLVDEDDFFYSQIFNKVNKYCRRKWNQWKANLRHNYFNTPWASISVIAAVILLLLTVLQSVYSVLAYYHQPDGNLLPR